MSRPQLKLMNPRVINHWAVCNFDGRLSGAGSEQPLITLLRTLVDCLQSQGQFDITTMLGGADDRTRNQYV
jgi:hypothetical protein